MIVIDGEKMGDDCMRLGDAVLDLVKDVSFEVAVSALTNVIEVLAEQDPAQRYATIKQFERSLARLNVLQTRTLRQTASAGEGTIFAMSLVAIRQRNGMIGVCHLALAVSAVSADEARGIGYRKIEAEAPKSEEWEGHDVVIIEVPRGNGGKR